MSDFKILFDKIEQYIVPVSLLSYALYVWGNMQVFDCIECNERICKRIGECKKTVQD